MDVVVGEVVGPDRGRLVARRAGRRGRAPRAPVRSTRAPVLADPAGAADLDAVDRDVRAVGVEGGPGRADGGQDAAPVGVVAEDRALEEVVAGDRRGPPRGASASAAPAAPRWRCRGAAPSASAMSWRARSAQTAVTASVSSPRSTATPEAPEASSEDGVVGRLAAVGVDPVEGRRGRGPQGRVELGRARRRRRW